MALVKAKSPGGSAVVINTERESAELRQAVSDGLGSDWTRVLNNECTIAYGPEWHQAPQQPAPSALLLAPEDPHLSGVSPNRYLSSVYLEDDKGLGISVGMFGTHLVSEANCIHKNVAGRAWREKTWAIQVNDVLNECDRVHKTGVPIVLSGDFNTGVYFTGKQLFALLQKRFGSLATHVHNGSLDQIFLISTDKVRLSEVGVEVETNNASDHNMVTAVIHAESVA